MSDYIIEAIKNGVVETLVMTFFSALFSYIIGLPVGVILYATSKGRLLQNRPVNIVLGTIVNIMRSLPFLILLVLLMPVFSIFVFIFVFVRIIQSEIRFDLGIVVEMVPAHVGRRANAAGSEAARGKRGGRQGRPERADEAPEKHEQTATAATGPRLPGQWRRQRR